ncbi:hypothetical protein PG985_003402 [Apiospora marii]|uniref:uncharacterized protein n=1 Tax=Apiospora marii TaxID=335849 RepID=UPI003130D943
MAGYNDPQQQQQPFDQDLEDWLHLTGWHQVEHRREKLEKWRDVHFEYETQRRAIMRGTYDRLDREHHEAQMGREMAGNNQALPQQGPGNFHHQALAFRPAPGAHRAEQQNAPATPRAARAAPAAPIQIRGRARERAYRSRSPIRDRSPPAVRGRRAIENAGNPPRGSRNQGQQRAVGYPIRDIDLGNDGDTRFFMIKSVDTRNIFTCWDDNLWATSSVEKGNILADAYDTSKNVVLFFSANGSHAIQGYARMIGPPSGNITKPEWYHLVSRDMSEPFPVEWLCKNVCSDRPMRHLSNRLNYDEETGGYHPPNRSRDCQEIDTICALEMMEIMKSNAANLGGGNRAD